MNRRGVALLAALWFIVAIATVGLALGLEAREHRLVGLAAADRRAAEAAAAGGFALARARLERALRQRPRTTGAASQMRAANPWIDPDSLFPEPFSFGNLAVRIHGEDIQAKLNINSASVLDLRNFLSYLLRDYDLADALSQAIADWRDRDDLRLPRGAERERYLDRRQLDLPTNHQGFRDLEELRGVEGMTPAIFAKIRPYLRTKGTGVININTAPAPVLRAIPGITDGMIARILSARSQHRLFTEDEFGGQGNGQSVTFTTTQLELTITVTPPPPARPLQSSWTVQKGGGGSGTPDQIRVEWTDFAG